MTNIFTAESFGADLPENWEEICDILNEYAEEHPDEEPNDIWESYWNGTLETEEKIDKDLFIAAVQDWEADSQYDDLTVEYSAIDKTDDGEWYIPAHDNDHSYMLVQDSEGNVHIV